MRPLALIRSSLFLFLVPLMGLISTTSLVLAEGPTPKNMVLVDPGGFMRGMDSAQSKSPGFQDTSPARMIYLSAYYIDIYEVSNADYIEFIKATDYPAPAYWDSHKLNLPNQPVVGVNWFDANAYCHWANKRLPTEAEWEKAARGPAGLLYPWGDHPDPQKANYGKGQFGKDRVTAPVDSYPEGKSYYGVYNMAGNAFEWVQDWYDPEFYQRSDEVRNPVGPEYIQTKDLSVSGPRTEFQGKKKVIRGGSWFAPEQSITTVHRFWNDPMNNSYGVGLGFRCAKSVAKDPSMEAREFYMNALVFMGVEKYNEAQESIQGALKLDPGNQEYLGLLELVRNQLKK